MARIKIHRAFKWAIGLSLFILLTLVMDSCMQFRMSASEIDTYFHDKPVKGTLHSYPVEGWRTITYLKVGDEDKPLVIFVHGSPGSLSAFIDFMSDTALLKKVEMITVDRPGFGSSNFGNAEPSLQKQAAFLKPILEENKSKRLGGGSPGVGRRIILIGHSLGGPVIARMAMDYPELIDGLIIVAGSIDPDLEPNETWFRAPLATPFLRWILPRSFRASNEELYKLKPQLQEMVPLWKNITAPVIIIQGKKDELVPAANADFGKKMLTNAASVDVVTKDDMNHFVPWSNPELIRDAIEKMVSKVD